MAAARAVPWQRGPSCSITMCPSSAAQRRGTGAPSRTSPPPTPVPSVERDHVAWRRARPRAATRRARSRCRRSRSRRARRTGRCSRSPRSRSASGMFARRRALPAARSIVIGTPNADRAGAVVEQLLDRGVEARAARCSVAVGRRRLDRAARIVPSRSTRAGEDLRPADVHADDPVGRHGAATIPRLMPAETSHTGSTGAAGSRGGARSRAPSATRPLGRRRERAPHAPRRRAAPPPPLRLGPSGRRSSVGLLVLVLIGWAIASYLAVRSGVERGERRGSAGVRGQPGAQDGLLLSTPTTILVLGTDRGDRRRQRASARRSDSIMLLRTDPRKAGSPTSRSRATSRSRSPASAREDQRREPDRRPRARRCARSGVHGARRQPRRVRRLRPASRS